MLICINPIWRLTNEKWLYLRNQILVSKNGKNFTKVFRYKDSFEIPFKTIILSAHLHKSNMATYNWEMAVSQQHNLIF